MKDLIKPVAIFVFAGVIFFSNGGTAGNHPQNLYSKTIPLSDNCVLKINESPNQSLTIGLYQYGNLTKSISIGNANTKDELIVPTRFDSKGGKYYFITAYDRSSTYGAQTNIVLWENGATWEMISAPFIRGFLEDRDKDGVFEIVERYPKDRVFAFDNGLFVEKLPR
jgi:hypothetical protein